MENQLNIGDQNTQQIGQNPVSKSISVPGKSKVNYWMISTIVLFILLILGGLYTIRTRNGFTNKISDQPLTKQENTPPIPSATNIEAEVKEFTTLILTNRKDLQSKLADQEIQIVHTDKNKSIWIVETIDKDYLKAGGTDQNALPRHVYLVTNSYWRQIVGDKLVVECLVGKFEQTKDTLVVQTNWNCQPTIYLYKLASGDPIVFSDPNGLVPPDKPWILGSGSISGIIPTDLGMELLEVTYTGPSPYGVSYYNINTGKLLDLVLFDKFTK